MGLIDRFTRDGASKYFWAILMLVAILGLVVAIVAGGDAIQEERLAAERRAVAAVEEVLDPRIDGSDLLAPMAGQELESLRGAAERSILIDPRVGRVRIWSEDGRLLFSTDRADQLGSNEALNDELLQRVADGTTTTRSGLSDTGGVSEQERSLLRTYTPIGSNAVVEVDHTDEGTVGPVRSSWRRYQILAGAVAALFLVMTILSLRDPVERINAGVPFAPSSVPAGWSLIDDDRLNAVEDVYRLAHDRVARLQEKLSESEEIRRQLEGDIQRALTGAATGATPPAPRPAAAPPAAAPPAVAAPTSQPAAPKPRPAPVRSQPAAAEARPAAAEAQPAPAKAQPAPARAQPTAAKAQPIAPKAQPVPRTKRPAVPRDVVKVPESEVLGETWVAAPSAPPTRDTRPAAAPEKPKRAPLLRRRPEPVASTSTAHQELEDAKAHEAALETFIRLTESDREQRGAAEVDQGAVRAALARTAARKKPGGQRLQPHDEPPRERPGGPPPRE